MAELLLLLYFWKKIGNMRKKILMIAVFSVFLLGFTGISSCKTGEGCGLEEAYAPKTGRDGQLSTKRGKSNLFGKKKRKKMRKGK